MTLTLHLIAESVVAFSALRDALVAALDTRDELPLQVFGNTKYIYCRPRRWSLPVFTDRIQTNTTAVIEFYASNPVLHDGTPP